MMKTLGANTVSREKSGMVAKHMEMTTERRNLLVGFLLLFFPWVSFMNAYSSGIKENMYLSVDYAHFRGDSSKVFVELYYSLGVKELRMRTEGSENSVAVRLDVSVRDNENDTLVLKRSWEIPHLVQDTSDLQTGRTLVGILNLWVKPGRYKLLVAGVDLNNRVNRDSVEFPMNLRSYANDSLSISDIELCTSIKQIEPDSRNIFYKNTLEVVPNPSVIYGLGLPIVYYYLEVYNLLKHAEGGDYVYTTSVNDAAGNEVLQNRKRKKRAHDSSVEVGTMNIGQLKSGTYIFKFTLTDSLSAQSISSSKKFFVYNPGVATKSTESKAGASGDYLASEYGLASEQDLDREIDYVHYFARQDEIERYEKLSDLEGKRKFLYDFWKRRDPDPSTRVNEFKQEYLARVAYANLNFRTSGKEGWKTDRGRVYVVYGSPDETERHPNEVDTKPYEIWYYHNIQGGVEFVFIDRSSFQDYRLVHSTHRTELRDDDWREQLSK